MALKAGFQEKLLFFSFFGVWGFSLSRYLIQAAISAASRHLSKNARQSGDTISSNINTFNTRYRKGALEGGKGLKLDQGGRTWQAFGGGKHGHETFRQARNYNFRDKRVVFARNLNFFNLIQ